MPQLPCCANWPTSFRSSTRGKYRGWPPEHESAGLGSRFFHMRRSKDRGPIGIWASGEELRRRVASTLGKAGYELGESAADLDTLTGSRPGCKAVVASAESDPIGRIS